MGASLDKFSFKIKSGISEGMDKNAENMIAKQRIMMMKQREMMLAMQIASQKDFFHWYSSFYVTVGILATAAFIKKKSTTGFVPLLPLTFGLAYQYDFLYGNKLERNIAEAERILEKERHLLRFTPPSGNLFISVEDYAKIFSETKSK